jgi:dTDP-4-amino-4,6-dideoxygalactose transaminase
MKTIRSYTDLAINGAPPAYEEPLHVGRPNIGDKTRYFELLADVLDRKWLTNDGPLVRRFEAELARQLNVEHVVAMCNGTVALEIAICALELTGEIIVPSYTFIATAHAMYWQGLTPVFADIDPATHCIDPQSAERAITPRTTGLIGVHLWGRPAPAAALERLCEERGLKRIFDAAHAFGVSSRGRMIGGFGECEVFSFHATKFLNSFEGGAVATNSASLAEKLRLMRNFGFQGYDNVVHSGVNGKMIEACAAMGLVNLQSAPDFIAENIRNFRAYEERLAELQWLRLLPYDEHERNNWQYIVVEFDETSPLTRDEALSALHAENIFARRYFWPGCHKMAPYRQLFPDADRTLPNTNRVARHVLVLPTGNSIRDGDVETVCSVLRALAGSR